MCLRTSIDHRKAMKQYRLLILAVLCVKELVIRDINAFRCFTNCSSDLHTRFVYLKHVHRLHYRKNNITAQPCSALPTVDQSYFTWYRVQPMTDRQTEHAQPIVLSLDHWCNADARVSYWTTRCVVNQVVPLQNNTMPHSKVQGLSCTHACSPKSSLSAGCTH